MKTFLTGLVAGTIVVGGVLAQQSVGEPPAQVPEDAIKEGGVEAAAVAEVLDPAELVRDLADEAFRVREAAQADLWALGDAGVAALEEGVKSDDPERSYRSRVLLRRIVTGIGPGTPEVVVELVERYFRGAAETKRQVLEKLREERAFSQVLRLYRFETDPAVREECAEVVEQVVVPAVSMELAKNDIPAAESLLRLAPPTDENLRRRAALSRQLGKLDEELQAVLEGKDDPLRLALLRAKGDVPEALALAEKLGREDVAAGLALLQGDPVPYFNWYAGQGNTMAIFRLNADLARDRWVGDERSAARISKIMLERAGEGAEEERIAMLSLLLNGYLDEAMVVWEKNPDYREFAYSHYETVELPEKAIEVFGYKGSAEEKKKWRSEKMEGLRGSWDESDEPLNALLTVAGFLVTRGEEEEGYEIAREVGKLVVKQGGQEEWLEYLDFLGRKPALVFTELAFVVAADSLKPDAADADVVQILNTLFLELEVPRRWWDRLKKKEGLSASERLLFLAGIYGYVYLEPEKLDPFLAEVHAQAADAAGAERRELLSDLLEPASRRDDAKEVLELLVLLADIDGLDPWANALGLYAGYLGDWDLAVKAWESNLKQSPYSYRSIAKLGAAYLQVGKLEKAVEQYRKADLFALDEADKLAELAEAVYTMGDESKAEEHLRRIILTSPPRSSQWLAATAEYSSYQKRAEQWRVAAAFAEIDTLYDIRDRSTYSVPVFYLRKRFEADLLRGLALHGEGKVDEAKALFDRCFHMLNGDGLLADDFFPLLRKVGLTEEHDRYFEAAYERIQESIKSYPKTHNSYNSAAWLASRAVRKLDEAQVMAETALSMRPRQAAYLDTMAEVWFAKRDREKAVEWSRKACLDSVNAGHARTGGAELRTQLLRFESGDFPVP